jgi:hypothetical protein
VSLKKELQNIYDQRGRLTPAIVVDEARPKSHPLHSRFEWNNGVAAEEWRRQQAGQLIRSCKVIYRKPDSEQRLEIRSWHAIAGPEGHGYEPTDRVASDPVLRAIVLRDMEREWKDMFARYSSFKEFLELVAKDLAEAV